MNSTKTIRKYQYLLWAKNIERGSDSGHYIADFSLSPNSLCIALEVLYYFIVEKDYC